MAPDAKSEANSGDERLKGDKAVKDDEQELS